MEKIYNAQQVAEMLQVSVITIRRYIKAGKLSASKVGKNYQVLESDIKKLLERFKVKPQKKGV